MEPSDATEYRSSPDAGRLAGSQYEARRVKNRSSVRLLLERVIARLKWQALLICFAQLGIPVAVVST